MQFHTEPSVDIEAFVIANLAPDWHPTKKSWAALEILWRCPELSQHVEIKKILHELLSAPKLDVRRQVAKILFRGGDVAALKHIVYCGLCSHPETRASQHNHYWPIDIVRHCEYFDEECIELVVRDIEQHDRVFHCDALAYLESSRALPIISRLRGGTSNCRRNAAYLAATFGVTDSWCVTELVSWANDNNEMPYLALRGLAKLWHMQDAQRALLALPLDCSLERRETVHHYRDALIFVADGDRAERINTMMQREYLTDAKEVKLYQEAFEDPIKFDLPSAWKYYRNSSRRHPVCLDATVLLADFSTRKMRSHLARQQWEWMKPWFECELFSYRTLLAGKMVGPLMSAQLPASGLEPHIGVANETQLLTVEYELSDYERAAQCWIEFPVRYRAPH